MAAPRMVVTIQPRTAADVASERCSMSRARAAVKLLRCPFSLATISPSTVRRALKSAVRTPTVPVAIATADGVATNSWLLRSARKEQGHVQKRWQPREVDTETTDGQ